MIYRNQELYGVDNISQSDVSKRKVQKTNLKKYGVKWAYLRKEARKSGSNNSCPNKKFAKLLKQNNITFSREKVLENYSYDFCCGQTLIEINPTPTHNVDWSPFGKEHLSKIDKNYHLNKTLVANQNGYRCIHIWDWDNIGAVIELLKSRQTIYGRQCETREISYRDALNFLNKYHIQGYAKDSIRIGLFYKDELVSVMTFGKPRYTNRASYEIIRYCSKYNVVGGSEKLFAFFLLNYEPDSIVSYCDMSKFDGATYIKLGFRLIANHVPGIHWAHLNKNLHFTDNLLRQQGYSRLVNKTSSSKDIKTKGKSNKELMLQDGFVRVYDCGQSTFLWKR